MDLFGVKLSESGLLQTSSAVVHCGYIEPLAELTRPKKSGFVKFLNIFYSMETIESSCSVLIGIY